VRLLPLWAPLAWANTVVVAWCSKTSPEALIKISTSFHTKAREPFCWIIAASKVRQALARIADPLLARARGLIAPRGGCVSAISVVRLAHANGHRGMSTLHQSQPPLKPRSSPKATFTIAYAIISLRPRLPILPRPVGAWCAWAMHIYKSSGRKIWWATRAGVQYLCEKRVLQAWAAGRVW